MTPIEELNALYDTYSQTIYTVRQKASPFAGILGLGNDPRRHSCHDAFYGSVEKWMAAFVDSHPDPEQAEQVVHWLLEQASLHEGEDTYWYLFVIQGFASPLIPGLTQRTCEQLRDWYKVTYPREKRMPVQQDVYKLLVQYSGQTAEKESFWKRIFHRK